jgi:peptidoglycan-N-acetylglucosamine deacetylase
MVGSMASAYPEAVRRVYNAGHSIGTHTQNLSYTFARMTPEGAAREINDGFASVTAALGDPNAVAPFFRFPGLLRTVSVEKYLADHSIMTWSADLDADDWHKIGAAEVLHRALSRLEARGSGVLLLHDIQPATVQMLPTLLKELKRRGFRVVQVTPAGVERPNILPLPTAEAGKVREGWPRLASGPDTQLHQ